MSFKKSLVPKVVGVAFNVVIEREGEPDEETGEREVYEDSATVAHYFNRPSPAAREALAEELNRSGKGRRIMKSMYSFWQRYIVSVDGYGELDGREKGTGDPWDGYFRDDIGMEHVQSATVLLLRKLGGEETDLVKKSA